MTDENYNEYLAYLNSKEGQACQIIFARMPVDGPGGQQGVMDLYVSGVFLKAFKDGVVMRTEKQGEQFWRWENLQTIGFPSKIELARQMGDLKGMA